MLEAIFFNLNDILLLTIVLESILMSGLLIWTKNGKKISNIILALFLSTNAFYLLGELIYWNEKLNPMLANISPNLLFILGFTSFLKGPLLYWYTRSFIFRDFKFSSKEYFHLIPLVIYQISMYFIYYSQEHAFKLSIIESYDVLISNPYLLTFDLYANINVIFYAAFSLYTLLKHKSLLTDTYANFTSKEYRWLQILIVGFLLVWSMAILSYLQVVLIDLNLSLGVISIYFHFILINVLLAYGLNNSKTLEEISPQYTFNQNTDTEVDFPYVELLKNKMEQEKLYLRKNITLERLAEELSIPVKQLSKTINGHFQKNFFEFINYYRVEEAKRLLSQHIKIPIQEVMEKSGFKSKSTFNRFFLKYALETPSEYRKRHH